MQNENDIKHNRLLLDELSRLGYSCTEIIAASVAPFGFIVKAYQDGNRENCVRCDARTMTDALKAAITHIKSQQMEKAA